MPGKNIVRQDIVQIAFDIKDSPLKKLEKEMQSFHNTTKKSMGNSESSLNNFSKSTQKVNADFKRMASTINGTNRGIEKFANTLRAGVQNGLQQAAIKSKQLANSLKKVDQTSLKKITDGIDKLGSKMGKGLVTASKKAISAIAKLSAAAVGGFGALTGLSVKSYGDYEQLVGGIETLFGTGGMSLEEYAKSVGKSTKEVAGQYQQLEKAQSLAMQNANNAYKTAGMSANDYMETITGFAASLKQSLGGDAVKAAQKADLALTDMSDNANKMGTDMESIKNAYQGFAKQNYTMLDNLKLGYGGTQEEMKRLLADAQKISGQKYDISSYADIVDAIHVVQTELGITGTTSKEAATTIQGSINSMKGAWGNFITGMADPDQNFGLLVDNLVDSVVTVANNIVPRIRETIPRLAQGMSSLMQQLFTLAAQNVDALGPLAPIGRSIINMLSTIKAKFQAIAADNEKMATIRTIFDGIKTAASYAAIFIGKAVVGIVNFCTQAPVLNTIKAIVSGLSKTFKFLGDHIGAIGNILAFVIGFLGSLATIIKVVTAVSKAWSVVQMIVNSGILACPITWIVLAIAGLIAIVVVLIKNWDKVKAVGVNCWNKIQDVWGKVQGWFKEHVTDPIRNFFQNLWDKLPGPVQGVVKKLASAFTWAFDKITGVFGGIKDFFKNLWKDTVTNVSVPVNKLIDGANWVLDHVGSDKHIDQWKPYAKGTKGHPGGNAIVNDGRGAELVQYPNGKMFIPSGRNVLLPNAPRGMKVLNAEQTARFMGRKSPTFNYADGTDGGFDVWSFFDAPKKLVQKMIDKFVDFKNMSGYALDVGKGMITGTKDAIVDWVKKLFKDSDGKDISSYAPSKGVEQWRSTVEQALKMENLFSAANVKRTLFQMETESGGNPRAINLTDRNAKNGTPSKGLMQVIDPTFRSYARKGYTANIYHPLSNILASVRYARSRYGSLSKAYRGVGYAGGIGLPSYDPSSSIPAYRGGNTSNNNYAPSFTLNMSGTVDRTTERTVKKWVKEAIEDTIDSMSRTSPRLQEV